MGFLPSTIHFELPSELGRCSRPRGESGDTSSAWVVYVMAVGSFDPDLTMVAADCIQWLVDRLGVRSLACSGLEMGYHARVSGRQVVLQEHPEIVTIRQWLHKESAMGLEGFLRRNRFEGVVHGLAVEQSWNNQVAALHLIEPLDRELSPAFTRYVTRARDRVLPKLPTALQGAFQRAEDDGWTSFAASMTLARLAKSHGVDLSRFPDHDLLDSCNGWEGVAGLLLESKPQVEAMAKGMARWAPAAAVTEIDQLIAGAARAEGNASFDVEQMMVTYRLLSVACGWAVRLGLEHSTFSAAADALNMTEAMLERFMWTMDSTGLRRETRELFAELLVQFDAGDLVPEFQTLCLFRDVSDYIRLELGSSDYLHLLASKPDAEMLLDRVAEMGEAPADIVPVMAALQWAKTFYLEAVVQAREAARAVTEVLDALDEGEGLLVETVGFDGPMVVDELERRRTRYCVVRPNFPLEPLKAARKTFYHRVSSEWAHGVPGLGEGGMYDPSRLLGGPQRRLALGHHDVLDWLDAAAGAPIDGDANPEPEPEPVEPEPGRW